MPSIYRSPSGRFIDWRRLLRDARKREGEWWLALPDERADLVYVIRYRRHPVLRDMVGTLEAEVDSVAEDRDGHRRGNVRIKYTR